MSSTVPGSKIRFHLFLSWLALFILSFLLVFFSSAGNAIPIADRDKGLYLIFQILLPPFASILAFYAQTLSKKAPGSLPLEQAKPIYISTIACHSLVLLVIAALAWGPYEEDQTFAQSADTFFFFVSALCAVAIMPVSFLLGREQQSSTGNVD